MNYNAINPNFKTSTYSDDQILDVDALLRLIDESNFYLKFRKGYVTSVDFDYITKANFDLDRRSEVVGVKTEEEKEKTRKNIKSVENYLQELTGKKIHLTFICRGDGECALYDANKFQYDRINDILIKEFSRR